MINILDKYKEDNFFIENNSIFLFPWSNYRPTHLFIIDLLNENIKDCNIILLSGEEYEFYPGSLKEIFTEKIKNKLVKNNVFVYFVYGSAKLKNYTTKLVRLYHQSKYNMFVNLWPTFWLNRTVSSNLKSCNYDYFLSKYKVDFKKENIKYLYITMNNVGKYHRCMLIDLLAKNNLLDLGAISWRNFCLDKDYSWKYTTPIKRTLSDFESYDKSTYDFQFTPPKEFFESFVSIIAETTVELIFLTEKTATAILYKQPFLVQGAPKFHQFLKSLGFQLYTEVFDYSFDNEEDLEIRTQMIIDNLNKIKNYDLNNSYIELKSKLDSNYNRLFEIIQDENFIPEIGKKYQIFLNHYKDDLSYDVEKINTINL
jgi:hypothetical protein